MNALRAESFVHTARASLRPVTGWPRLPAAITLDRVIGVGVDSKGMIYVAHRGENPLLCLHPDGRLCREVGVGVMRKTTAYDLRGPVPVPIATRYWLHGLHIDPWDNVWVTDVGRHLVMKFDSAGALLMTLGVDGKSGCDERHFAQPTHVCVVPSGEFFMTDGYGNSRIVKFSAQGKYLLEWGTRGTAPGEFHTPHVIVVGPDGLLYMTDRENDRVQVFRADGTHVATWPDLHSVDGLYAAPDGYIYGSGGIDNAIIRFDRTGRVLDVWVLNGMLNYPHAIAVGKDGALYVAETGDTWKLTGRLPAEREMMPRSGPEGSALTKLLRSG
jgi:DNA-binding beta-propeller fold protein YncE